MQPTRLLAVPVKMHDDEVDVDDGLVRYTDLGNPTFNSIYRAIGYHAIEEALHDELRMRP